MSTNDGPVVIISARVRREVREDLLAVGAALGSRTLSDAVAEAVTRFVEDHPQHRPARGSELEARGQTTIDLEDPHDP